MTLTATSLDPPPGNVPKLRSDIGLIVSAWLQLRLPQSYCSPASRSHGFGEERTVSRSLA
jgi:hypothetical protein